MLHVCSDWDMMEWVCVGGAPAEQFEVQSLYRNSNCFENFDTPLPHQHVRTYTGVPLLFHVCVT